jgi:hypothetical protein
MDQFVNTRPLAAFARGLVVTIRSRNARLLGTFTLWVA